MLHASEEKKDIEEVIKEAARKIFIRKGLSGARLQDIADEAGIGRTSLHYYYRSKEKLFDAVISEKFYDVKYRLGNTAEKNLPLEEKLTQFTRDYFARAMEDPELDIFLLNEFNAHPTQMLKIVHGHEFTRSILEDIEQAIRNGEMQGDAQQHFITFMSVTFFPFAAKNMIQQMLQCSEEDYMQFMQTREEYIIGFIRQYFKKPS